jgi:cardiolipin synthase
MLWGGALYLWSAALYVYQLVLALRRTPGVVAA